MKLAHTVFKRKFALSMVKNLRLGLGTMTFTKDFLHTDRGDLYPLLEHSEDCCEEVKNGRYHLGGGRVKRLLGQFFPYATYELTAAVSEGSVGFSFRLPRGEASVLLCRTEDTLSLRFAAEEVEQIFPLSSRDAAETLLITCRPGAFDVYLRQGEMPRYLTTFRSAAFAVSDHYRVFSNATAALSAEGEVTIAQVCFYLDNGISQADLRPIRYENGQVMVEQGKVYLTASIRLQEGCFQGIFSWVPGTAEFALTGALFYDAGDGKWGGDVAASVLYHRADQKWYIWVCSFCHGHVLGHTVSEGDIRFGVNVVDITLMEKASEGAPISTFAGFFGDEDPDFYFDEDEKKWYLAICRDDPVSKGYKYVFFASDSPFAGYTCIGSGLDGAETGGSFLRVGKERCFVCGNSFETHSEYRIYGADGMETARFDYPDGGFRGWGSILPVQMGTRKRWFWLTFDRHRGSEYNWSYGNLYCFEGDVVE